MDILCTPTTLPQTNPMVLFFNLVREGNLSIELKLKETSTESITVVCYLEYDSIIEIDSDRNIHTNE